jgi:hypothetical protein
MGIESDDQIESWRAVQRLLATGAPLAARPS